MTKDTYKEIKSETKGIYKEKGSKFIAYCYPVYSQKDIKEKIEHIKKIEHTARHYCYAYVLNPDQSIQQENDDGEPSSSAGKPILRQIISYNLTNTLIIVVRYFGGVKLGIPGLIRSYKNAALEAISKAKINQKTIKEKYTVNFQYTDMNNVMRLVKKFNLEIINTELNMHCKLILAIPKSKSKSVVELFNKNHKLKIEHLKIK